MSLVFYKNVNPNNWYCEPNRLFQSINNGIPVVVGNNPPMKELVEKYGVGVCAETDGGDVKSIINAIEIVIGDYEGFKHNLEANAQNWLWNQQDNIMREIVEKLFN